LGQSEKVFFKRFQAKRSYGGILSKVDEIKGNWKGSNYNLLTHNCRYFSDEFSEFITNKRLELGESFNYEGSFNVSISKKIL
jgi:hypothetical protein